MFEYHNFGRNQTILSNWAQIGGKFSGAFRQRSSQLWSHTPEWPVHFEEILITIQHLNRLLQHETKHSLFVWILLTGFVWIASNYEKIVGFRRNPVDKTSKLGPPNPESTPKPLQASKDLASSSLERICKGTSLWGQLHPGEDANFSKGSKFQGFSHQHKGDSHDSKSILTNPNVRKNQANSTISGGEATQHGKLSLEA